MAATDGNEPKPSAPTVPDIENGAPWSAPSDGTGTGTGGDEGGAVVTSVLRRWKREDLLEKSTLPLRALGCLFSLVMASNKHGDRKNFDRYLEYNFDRYEEYNFDRYLEYNFDRYEEYR